MFPSACIDLLMSEKIENTRWKEGGGEGAKRRKLIFFLRFFQQMCSEVMIYEYSLCVCFNTRKNRGFDSKEKGCDDKICIEWQPVEIMGLMHWCNVLSFFFIIIIFIWGAHLKQIKLGDLWQKHNGHLNDVHFPTVTIIKITIIAWYNETPVNVI